MRPRSGGLKNSSVKSGFSKSLRSFQLLRYAVGERETNFRDSWRRVPVRSGWFASSGRTDIRVLIGA